MDGKEEYVNDICGRTLEILPARYDSGVTILLDEDAYEINPGDFQTTVGENPNILCINWLSDGCRRIYEWAKAHHVRVKSLQAMLAGKKVEL